MLDLTTKNIEYLGTPIVYSYMKSDPSGEGCIREIVSNDEYNLGRFKNLVGETLIDIGANNGLVTLILALQNPDSTIICVEPSWDLYQVICKNVMQNKLTNVHILQVALHSKNCEIDFLQSTICTGASITTSTSSDLFSMFDNKHSQQKVAAITFDKLVEDFKIASIYFLKIDCEGGEYSLYESKSFQNSIVKHLGGEFHETFYLNSQKGDALNLLEFCKQYVLDYQITILRNFKNEALEVSIVKSETL